QWRRTSFTTLIVGVFVVYVLHTCWVMYGIVYTKPCEDPKFENCINPYLAGKPRLQLSIYTALRPNADGGHTLIHKEEDFDVETKFERIVNVSLPKKTCKNGTLYAMVFVHQAGMSPWQDPRQVHLVSQLTTYMIPKPPEVSLVSGEEAEQQKRKPKGGDSAVDRPVSHWRSRLTLNVVSEDFIFDRDFLPSDVHRYLRVFQNGKKRVYLPVLFVDELSNRVKDLMEINSTSTELPLTISYDTISLGKLRFWIHMQDAVYSLQQFGFTEKDADEIKGIFVETNMYFLALTFFIAAFHLLFDFLAFKHDISFWKQKKSMVGMSSKAVLWRCFSTIVIFMYLFDEQTSLLVLIPAGVGSMIEVWKVKKAFKIQVIWKGVKPTFIFGKSDESERRTVEYDTLAMKYLWYLLYPMCIGGAVYALVIEALLLSLMVSFLTGVYAFGFLFMLPQLFVNYKFKSVAHLPWKAFMYKVSELYKISFERSSGFTLLDVSEMVLSLKDNNSMVTGNLVLFVRRWICLGKVQLSLLPC
uniref:Lipid scramblase CLPTM1L n=1 Tax=Salmo trutta TaxID=8032 RepID=A0A674EHF7_SALTR